MKIFCGAFFVLLAMPVVTVGVAFQLIKESFEVGKTMGDDVLDYLFKRES